MFSPICVSWDFNVKRGNWTSTGCTLSNVNNESGVFTCACNHLTNFAVLVVSLRDIKYFRKYECMLFEL